MKKGKPLKFRCLLEQEGGLYLAYCIDLSLAVQGDSEQEVRDKLHAMIVDYVQDALQAKLQGDEDEYRYMMSRVAPLSIRARYRLAAMPGGKAILLVLRKLLHIHRLRPYHESMDNTVAC